jgi:hypothetical protein
MAFLDPGAFAVPIHGYLEPPHRRFWQGPRTL